MEKLTIFTPQPEMTVIDKKLRKVLFVSNKEGVFITDDEYICKKAKGHFDYKPYVKGDEKIVRFSDEEEMSEGVDLTSMTKKELNKLAEELEIPEWDTKAKNDDMIAKISVFMDEEGNDESDKEQESETEEKEGKEEETADEEDSEKEPVDPKEGE